MAKFYYISAEFARRLWATITRSERDARSPTLKRPNPVSAYPPPPIWIQIGTEAPVSIGPNKWRYRGKIVKPINVDAVTAGFAPPDAAAVNWLVFNAAEYHNDGVDQEGSGEVYTGTQTMRPIMAGRITRGQIVTTRPAGPKMFIDVPNSPAC